MDAVDGDRGSDRSGGAFWFVVPPLSPPPDLKGNPMLCSQCHYPNETLINGFCSSCWVRLLPEDRVILQGKPEPAVTRVTTYRTVKLSGVSLAVFYVWLVVLTVLVGYLLAKHFALV